MLNGNNTYHILYVTLGIPLLSPHIVLYVFLWFVQQTHIIWEDSCKDGRF